MPAGMAAAFSDYCNRLPHRCSGRNHVVYHQHPSFQGRSHQSSFLSVVFGLLAIETPGQVATGDLRKSHRGGGDQRDTLVGRPVQHIEFETMITNCFGVIAPETGQCDSAVE